MAQSYRRNRPQPVENRPPNVGRQFFDRVGARRPRGLPLPPGRRVGVDDLAGDRRARSPASPPAWWRWASSPSSGSASPRPRGMEWILADLAIMSTGARDHDGLPVDDRRGRRASSSPTPSAALSSPRTTTQIAKISEHRTELPQLAKVVTFDGTADGDWVISLADLETSRGGAARPGRPTSSSVGSTSTKPEALATLIYTSGTTGRPKGVRLRHSLLDLRGRRDRRRRASSARTTCSSCGCRWRTRSARCCCPPSSRSASPPPSTAGSTRSSRTWQSSGRRSWVPLRASSRRRTTGSSRCSRPRAA